VPATDPFYQDAGGVTRTPTGQHIDELSLYAHDADVAPIPLAPGATYRLSVVNAAAPVFDAWAWTTPAGFEGGNGIARIHDGEAWGFSVASEVAFNLTGPAAVPGPATLAVFGALAVGAFGVRRRAKVRA